MKKFFVFVIVSVFIGFWTYVSAGEMEEKQLMLRAIQWEFNYCNERLKVLQKQAEEVQLDMAKLRKEAAEAAIIDKTKPPAVEEKKEAK